MKQRKGSTFIGGQSPKHHDESGALTICSGYVRNGKSFPCPEKTLMKAKTGVTEPRCPSCYRLHINSEV